jgi:hypothetical protein
VGANRIAGMGWLVRRVPVVAVAALAVAGTPGAGASAAAQPREAGVQPAVAGTISTVAGGVGGPARATNVPITNACGVSVANGLLYIADNTTVRRSTAPTG